MVQYEQLIPFMWATNSVACIICITFTVMAIYFQNCRKNVNPEQNSEVLSVKYSATMAMILFSITCGVQNVTVSYLSYSIGFQIFQIVTQCSWLIAQISCCFMFIFRLRQTFKNTKWAISKTTISMFYVSLFIFMLINIAIWTIFTITYNTSDIPDITAFKINSILTIIVNIMDSIISFCTVYLYSSKLLQCMEKFNDDLYTNIATIAQRNNDAMSGGGRGIRLSSTQKMLVELMTKLFLISFLALGSTQIYLISQVILYSMVKLRNDGDPLYFTMYFITIILQSFSCVINTICIYTTFDFSEKFYNNLCSKAHGCFAFCCSNYAKRRMNKAVELNFYHRVDPDYNEDSQYSN